LQHLIQKQTLELTLTNPGQSYQIQEMARQVLLGKTMTEMDDALSHLPNSNRTCLLERIILDVGSFVVADFENEFPRRLVKALNKELSKKIYRDGQRENNQQERVLASSDAKLEILEHFLQTGELVWWASDAAKFNPENLLNEVLEDSPERLLAMLGRQRWRTLARRLALQLSPSAVERLLALALLGVQDEVATVLEEWLRVTEDTSRVSEAWFNVPHWVKAATAAAMITSEVRSAQNLTAAIGSILVETFGCCSGNFLKTLDESARIALPRSSPVREWIAIQERTQRQDPAFSGEGPANSGSTPPDDAPRAAVIVAPKFDHSEATVVSVSVQEQRARHGPASEANTFGLEKSPNRPFSADSYTGERHHRSVNADSHEGESPSCPKAIAETSEIGFSQIEQSNKDLRSRGEAATNVYFATDDAVRTPAVAVDIRKSRRALSGLVLSEADAANSLAHCAPLDQSEFVFYIGNAGLVLLWPFLPRFFEATSLVCERSFVSSTAQARAVLLLHYLVTGVTETAEHLLLLDKLLCGYELAEPIARAFELTETELKQANDLLLSVITHWKALKGTTIDGLRTAFLQREGRLEQKETGWRLTLERTGYDVLLDRLPWSVGVVVLPWMKQLLMVEW
jgi:hypothetical protein